jgi:D-alanyl-D-alanine carboxypeptidase
MGKSLDALASYFRPQVDDFLAECQTVFGEMTIEDTDRDPATQAADIAAGRSWTTHSKHLPQPPEMKSEALDCLPKALLSVKQWGWYGTIENSDPRWLQMGQIGEKHGMEWGGRWANNPPHSRPDPGHFQYLPPTNFENVQTASSEG